MWNDSFRGKAFKMMGTITILEICIPSVHKNSLNLSYLYLLELYVTCYVHTKGVKKECYATISAPK